MSDTGRVQREGVAGAVDLDQIIETRAEIGGQAVHLVPGRRRIVVARRAAVDHGIVGGVPNHVMAARRDVERHRRVGYQSDVLLWALPDDGRDTGNRCPAVDIERAGADQVQRPPGQRRDAVAAVDRSGRGVNVRYARYGVAACGQRVVRCRAGVGQNVAAATGNRVHREGVGISAVELQFLRDGVARGVGAGNGHQRRRRADRCAVVGYRQTTKALVSRENDPAGTVETVQVLLGRIRIFNRQRFTVA